MKWFAREEFSAPIPPERRGAHLRRVAERCRREANRIAWLLRTPTALAGHVARVLRTDDNQAEPGVLAALRADLAAAEAGAIEARLWADELLQQAPGGRRAA